MFLTQIVEVIIIRDMLQSVYVSHGLRDFHILVKNTRDFYEILN
jgi:hypothetical protein